MREIISRKFKNVNDIKAFQCGFEVEFIFDEDKIELYQIKNLMRDLHKDIVCGEDNSIEISDKYDCEGTVEVRTPPLVIKDSLELLFKVFKVVKKYGYTNDSCGLHVSFSPFDDNVYHSLDPEKLIRNKLWNKMLKDFNREDNEYCQPFEVDEETNKNVSKLEKFYKKIYEDEFDSGSYGYEDHYTVVNFENYSLRRNKASRLEIRAMGNENYHKQFAKVVKYVNQILTVFKQSYEVKFQ